jgi:hypothetical protein
MKNSKIAKEANSKLDLFSSKDELSRKKLALTYVDLTRCNFSLGVSCSFAGFK